MKRRHLFLALAAAGSMAAPAAHAGVDLGTVAGSEVSLEGMVQTDAYWYDNDAANLFRRQPAYGLVDLKLEHRVQRLTAALEVRNLFDEKYYSYGIWNGASSFSAYPQPERAVYLSLAYRLD